MSPRKTRRGAKSMGNDTLSETISKTTMAETPGEKQKKTRTRRQVTKVSSLESDADHSPEINKSKRVTQAVQDTPSKATRSRKKVLLDNTVLDDPETSIVITKTRRTRKGKGNETLMEQTVLLDSTTLDESSGKANKSRGTRARKKNAKNADFKSSDEETLPRKRINASAAIDVTIIENSVDSTTDDTAVSMSDEDTEVLLVSSRISRLRAAAAAAAPASPLPTNRRSRNTKQRLEDFTPESSPITVSLTPHRTTKTPRKSPMNLGSPKSHADAPLRLPKTPRKLPVVVESPVPSEMSGTSSTHSTPAQSVNSTLVDPNITLQLEKSPKSAISPRSPRKSVGKSPRCPRKSVGKSPRSPRQSVGKSPRSPRKLVGKTSVSPRKSVGKSPRSPRKSVGKSPLSPRKSVGESTLSPRKSVGKSLRSPRKSVGKSALSPRKSVGKSPLSPRKSVGKSPRSPRKSVGKSPLSPRKSVAKSPLSPRKSVGKSPRSPRKSVEKSPRKSSEKSPRSPNKIVSVRKFSKSPKIVLRSPKAKSVGKSPRSPRKSVEKSPRKSSEKSPRSPNKIVSVRKFSKSPKIVIRSPKAKSAKSKTPRVTSTKVKRASIPKRLSKSPPKRSRPSSAASSPLKSAKSPKSARKSKSPSPKKPPTSPRRTAKFSAKMLDSPARMSLQLARVDSPKLPRVSKLSSPSRSRVQSPSVMLRKISPKKSEAPETATRSSLRRTPVNSPKSTPRKSASAEKRSSQGAESPHRPKSTTKKRAAVTELGTPLRPVDSPRSIAAAKQAVEQSIILSSSSTPVEMLRVQSGSGGKMLSSTPRERTRPSSDAEESVILGPKGGAWNLDGTYELDDKNATIVVETEENKTGNGTYDLAEPKTPNLRKKVAKRSLGDMDTSAEERAVKRTCRVRFASPDADESEHKTIGTVFARSRSATPGHRAGVKRTSQTPNGSGILGLSSGSNSVDHKSRRRSSSMTNVSLLKTSVTPKRRSNSVSDPNARSASRKAQNASANRLSKPRLSIPSAKKPEVKTPVARKLPNFAQIHQKKFAQMESLVDAKKRVEKRHIAAIAMSSKIPTNSSKVNAKAAPKLIPPVVAPSGGYNRFGFKLKKGDATKIVTQKQPTCTRQEKKNENRLLLKGVRTNRRFDLIMKARNINI